METNACIHWDSRFTAGCCVSVVICKKRNNMQWLGRNLIMLHLFNVHAGTLLIFLQEYIYGKVKVII